MSLDLAAPLTVEFGGAHYQVLNCAVVSGQLVNIQITQVEAP